MTKVKWFASSSGKTPAGEKFFLTPPAPYVFFLTSSSEERQKRNTGTADIHNVLFQLTHTIGKLVSE